MKKTRRSKERGQAAVIVGFALVGLLAFAALAIDGGNAYLTRRNAQNGSDAAAINAYDFLLGRAQQCAAQRGQIPNFVAINFYLNGDVLAVVDELNGVREAAAP